MQIQRLLYRQLQVFQNMHRHFEAICLMFGLLFVACIGISTTFFFIRVENETVQNKVAELLLQRQEIMRQVQLTDAVKDNYPGLAKFKTGNYNFPRYSIYN